MNSSVVTSPGQGTHVLSLDLWNRHLFENGREAGGDSFLWDWFHLLPFFLGRYMLGKGGKRKFDEHEMGWKAKFVSPSDGPSKVSYTLQRQTIFNISLMKLYNHRPLTSPACRRPCSSTTCCGASRRSWSRRAACGRVPRLLAARRRRRPAGASAGRGARLQPAAPAPCELGGARPWRPASPPPRCSGDDDPRTRFALPRRQPARLAPPALLPPEKDSFSSALDEDRGALSLCLHGGRGGRRPRRGTPPAGPALRDPRGCRTAGPRTRNWWTPCLATLRSPRPPGFPPQTWRWTTSCSPTLTRPCTTSTPARPRRDRLQDVPRVCRWPPPRRWPLQQPACRPEPAFQVDLTELDHIMEVLVGSWEPGPPHLRPTPPHPRAPDSSLSALCMHPCLPSSEKNILQKDHTSFCFEQSWSAFIQVWPLFNTLFLSGSSETCYPGIRKNTFEDDVAVLNDKNSSSEAQGISWENCKLHVCIFIFFL